MYEVGHDILRRGHASGGDKIARARLRVIHTTFVILFVVFIGRTLMLGLHGARTERMGNGAAAWVATRADIVDRNGEILAKNTISGNIILRPPQVRDADAAAVLIHNVIPEKTISDALADINSGKKYMVVKKLADDSQIQEIKAANIPGISVEATEWRRYPKRRLFSHLVGFVGSDMHGQEGMELIADKYLMQNKDPLVLSVDSRIQAVVYSAMANAMDKYHAKAAMGMLMNARTGEILAMVDLPDYDPENKDSDPVSNRLFHPMRAVYEMGSIFKIFNTAMAIENGLFDKKYFVDAPFKVLDRLGRVAATIHDIDSLKKTTVKQPYMAAPDIMLNSCNVGSAQISQDFPDGTQAEFFGRIHMDQSLALDFGTISAPLMPEKWGPVERATVSFGHGISVTPVHVLLAVNAMTNGGIYIWPTIYKRGIGAVAGERVVSNELSANLRDIMFKIATETSGKKAQIAGINIGGKTATAEKRKGGVVSKTKNLTAFVGVFPIEAPQYTMLVILDEPEGTAETYGLRTAAWNAVPTAGIILDSVLPVLFNN
ncbi:MAG: penicillin-binding protein 2 [Proteobacteria bacterium]|nr:penicillin-binding protein 2 [Pseudomonadota bacterium]